MDLGLLMLNLLLLLAIVLVPFPTEMMGTFIPKRGRMPAPQPPCTGRSG
ncbi:MAG: hypothetical protein ACR2MY_13815 [Candidatus Dormibacteria bacterium]